MTTVEKIGLRLAMYDEQRGRCRWCNQLMIRPRLGKMKHPLPSNMATIDHVVPLSRGGTDARSNLVLACQACNAKHANSMPIERELGL